MAPWDRQANITMLGEKTVNALLFLKPSGPQSFEDLLRELLSELTGKPYHLCASGWQGGDLQRPRDLPQGRGGTHLSDAAGLALSMSWSA
jgi:hypothetical protein